MSLKLDGIDGINELDGLDELDKVVDLCKKFISEGFTTCEQVMEKLIKTTPALKKDSFFLLFFPIIFNGALDDIEKSSKRKKK